MMINKRKTIIKQFLACRIDDNDFLEKAGTTSKRVRISQKLPVKP